MSYVEKVRRNIGDIASVARKGPAERSALRRRYQFDCLRKIVSFGGIETEEGLLFFSTQDRTIGRHVYVEGGWERRLLLRTLALAEVEPQGAYFVEVGANIGTTTVAAARQGAHVLAFEPAPLNYRLLRANVAVNLLDEHVTATQAACSDTPGTLTMRLSPVNHGDHRIDPTGDVQVPVVRLDDALGGRHVDLLWVDTQGHEASVFAGAPQTLAARPPLLVELWPSVLGETLPAFAKAVSGYERVLDMCDELPTTVLDAAQRHRYGATDLLLLS